MSSITLDYSLFINDECVKTIEYDYARFNGYKYLETLQNRKSDFQTPVNPANDYALHFDLGVGIIIASNPDKGWTRDDFKRTAGSDLWKITQIGLIFFGATPEAQPGDNTGEPSGSTLSDSTLAVQS